MPSRPGCAPTGSFSFIVKRPDRNNLYLSLAPPRGLTPLILLRDYLVPALAELGAEICLGGAPVEDRGRPVIVQSAIQNSVCVVTVAMDDAPDGTWRNDGLEDFPPGRTLGIPFRDRYLLTVETVRLMLEEADEIPSS